MRNTEREGRRVGPYTLLDPLATGGVGQVFLARRDHHPTPCVVKILREDVAKLTTVRERFVREAAVGALLDHPRIARVLDAGYTADSFFIALEWVLGVDVLELATTATIDADIGVSVVVETLEALAYLHDARDGDGALLGLVHRDLSLRNIMVGVDGGTRVIDFGVARMKLGGFETAPGMVMGTLRYLAPELVVDSSVDRRADLYAVGVVLWELLAKRSWIEDGPPAELFAAIANRTLPPIDERFDTIIARATHKDPARRYSDAGQMREELLAVTTVRDPSEWLRETLPEVVADLEMRWDAFDDSGTRSEELTRVADEVNEPTWVIRDRRHIEASTPPESTGTRWPWVAAVAAVLLMAFFFARSNRSPTTSIRVVAPAVKIQTPRVVQRPVSPGAPEPTNLNVRRVAPKPPMPKEPQSNRRPKTPTARVSRIERLDRIAATYRRDGKMDRDALRRLIQATEKKRGKTAAIAAAKRCLDRCASFGDMIDGVREAIRP